MAKRYPNAFRFFDLPVELQVTVMSCDSSVALSLVRTSKKAEALYCSNSQSILRSLLGAWPHQMQCLIRTILALRQGLVFFEDDYESAVAFFQTHLMPSSHSSDVQIEYPPLRTLELLRTLTLDVEFFRHLIVDQALTMAAIAVGAPRIDDWPPLWYDLSNDKIYRIDRGLLRAILYSEVVDSRPFRERPLLQDPFAIFSQWSQWEAEELQTADKFIHRIINSKEYYQNPNMQKFFSRACPDSMMTIVPANKGWYSCILPAESFKINRSARGQPSCIWEEAYAANSANPGHIYMRTVNSSVDNTQAPWIRPDLCLHVWLLHLGFYMWDSKRLLSWKLPPAHDPEAFTALENIRRNYPYPPPGDTDRLLQKLVTFWEHESKSCS
ncbi:hypothetical protein K469DRAFT_713810 [Zopfia rhizophila CBS 207.26]|uniref:Uncharacterized protein n=1 Tax=Zopfia rhizophila CBS 207.26 TaxID=1314779 RepID=A0A6A6DSL0_9PEZI|nr:hypothetical protein K469DRAFT_713810 [Zopfia rhizophila CBS 207.26]